MVDGGHLIVVAALCIVVLKSTRDYYLCDPKMITLSLGVLHGRYM